MSIHDSENNLGDINNSCENQDNYESKIDDNNVEMNPYADNLNGIHAPESHENSSINMEEKIEENKPVLIPNSIRTIMAQKLKQMHIKQQQNRYRNDIMRSVAIHQQSVKQQVKQAIAAGRRTTRSPVSTQHRLQKLIRNNSDCSKQIPNMPAKFKPPIRCELSNKELETTKLFVDQMLFPKPIDNVVVENKEPVPEKPKPMEMVEILTAAITEVLNGKLTSIESIIGKLRVNFEEKNIFTNTKKKQIIMLNFEDDSMRPVIQIDDKYMKIIKQWYDDCELLMDIEETNVFIPENIIFQDMSGVLFQDINCKFKDEYLNDYIPLVINNIISDRTIKGYEKKYEKRINPSKPSDLKNRVLYKNEPSQSTISRSIISDNILSKMGIDIPKNMKQEDTFIKKTEEWITKEWITPEFKNINSQTEKKVDQKFGDSALFYGSSQYEKLHDITINRFFDDEILIKNPKPEDISSKNADVSTEVLPYNSGYNSLYPSFASNCLVFNEEVEQKPVKEKKSTIFVLINDKFLNTITIQNPDEDVLHIIENNVEFGFIKLFGFTTNNKDVISFVEREFNKTIFNDIEEINKKLLVASQYIDFSDKQNQINDITSNEENIVKKFLNSKYTIDDDINHKMKASTLYDIIINSNIVKIDNNKIGGFRTRLSKYLKDIGLQKKRYNDGFYYYGIVEKHVSEFMYSFL
jgi:hypothetical protein